MAKVKIFNTKAKLRDAVTAAFLSSFWGWEDWWCSVKLQWRVVCYLLTAHSKNLQLALKLHCKNLL